MEVRICEFWNPTFESSILRWNLLLHQMIWQIFKLLKFHLTFFYKLYAIVCWEEGREAYQSSIAGLKTVKYGGYLRCARAENGRHHPVFSAARPEPACLGPVVQPWRAGGLKASLTLPAWTCMATLRPSHERAILWNQARKFVDVRQKAALSKTTTMTLWSMVFAQNRFATRKSA